MVNRTVKLSQGKLEYASVGLEDNWNAVMKRKGRGSTVCCVVGIKPKTSTSDCSLGVQI